jgi:hypothetical protein
MGSDKNMQAISANIASMFSQSSTKLSADPRKQKEYLVFLQSEMTRLQPLITADMVPLYEKYFTQQEIQKYIDFYSTPEISKFRAGVSERNDEQHDKQIYAPTKKKACC